MNVTTLEGGHRLAPNDYVITINTSDHEQLANDRDLTTTAFAKHLAGYIREHGWQTYGEVHVRFEPSDALHTGQFRARGVVNPDAGAPSQSPGAPPAPPCAWPSKWRASLPNASAAWALQQSFSWIEARAG